MILFILPRQKEEREKAEKGGSFLRDLFLKSNKKKSSLFKFL